MSPPPLTMTVTPTMTTRPLSEVDDKEDNINGEDNANCDEAVTSNNDGNKDNNTMAKAAAKKTNTATGAKKAASK